MAYVQTNQANANSPTVIAYDNPPAAGSTSLVFVRLSDNTQTISSVVGTQGSYGAPVYGPFTDPTTQTVVALYAKANLANSAESITVTMNVSDTCRVIIAEFSGRATSSPIDQENHALFGAGDTAVSSGNITTTENNEDLAGFLAINGGSVQFTASGSFTERTETDGDRIGFSQRDNVAIGTYAFTGTLDSSDAYFAIVVSLKATGGAAAAAPRRKALTMLGVS